MLVGMIQMRGQKALSILATSLLDDKWEGYFYLIDEEAGDPVVSQLDSCYPLVIKEQGPIVHNLLPLMLVGMVQMRGQKALSILATSLLDDKWEGYFYLIDEEAGDPVVSQLDSCYPLVIKKQGPIVHNLLPLMLVGMVQMRGQKALSILATSLLDDSIMIVPQHSSHTAKAVERQLLSTKLNEDSGDYNEVRELQEVLTVERSLQWKRGVDCGVVPSQETVCPL